MSQEETEEYEVEAVIDKRVKNGHTEYQLKWKGYPGTKNELPGPYRRISHNRWICTVLE